ncbi:hypothetical protein GGI12_003882 [Dipsacomyces acuminosporus]|nr:hypothetical protein GGI12_003882 [Dipsacomyces acuminosporus]
MKPVIITALAAIAIAAPTTKVKVKTDNAPVYSSPKATSSGRVLSLQKGTAIDTLCQLTSDKVQGSSVWYAIAFSEIGTSYIPSAYTTTPTTKIPECPKDGPAILVAVIAAISVAAREGIVHVTVNTNDAKLYAEPKSTGQVVMDLKKGDKVEAVCHLTGDRVKGKNLWYVVGEYYYIPAAYVAPPAQKLPKCQE